MPRQAEDVYVRRRRDGRRRGSPGAFVAHRHRAQAGLFFFWASAMLGEKAEGTSGASSSNGRPRREAPRA